MDQITALLKKKDPVAILTLISLFFTFFAFICSFAQYEYVYSSYSSGGYYTLEWGTDIFTLLFRLLSLTAVGMFAAHLLKLGGDQKAKLWITIAFGTIAFPNLLEAIQMIVYGYTDGILILYPLVDLTVAVFFALAAYNAYTERLKGSFCLIAIIIGLVLAALSLFSFCANNLVHYVALDLTFYILSWIVNFLGTATLYVALFINERQRTTKAFVQAEAKNLDQMPPAQALQALKDMLDCGVITELEYKIRRAEIISNL